MKTFTMLIINLAADFGEEIQTGMKNAYLGHIATKFVIQ
jgi:hypothetical protein